MNKARHHRLTLVLALMAALPLSAVTISAQSGENGKGPSPVEEVDPP